MSRALSSHTLDKCDRVATLRDDLFSQAISGAVSKWSLTMLFVGAGVLILLVTLWAAPQPGLKTFSDSMASGKPEAQLEEAS